MEKLFDSAFPGADFEQTLRGAAAAEKAVADKITKLKRDIELTNESRAFLELSGRDPVSELRGLKVQLQKADGELQNCRHKKNQIFGEEFSHFQQVWNHIWGAIYGEVIQPQAAELRELSQRIIESIGHVTALRNGTEGSHAEMLRALDAGAETFRRLCAEEAAPGNYRLAEGDSLSGIVMAAMQKNIRQNFEHDKIVRLLRDTLDAKPAKSADK